MEKNNWIDFLYDFERKTYDSTNWWTTMGGAPTEDATGLKLSASSASMLGDFRKGDLEMKMIIPTEPTAGNFRQWGWREGGNGAYAYFQISGTTFSLETADGDGNTESTTVTWNSSWTNTPVKFRIQWDASGFTFFAGTQQLGKISEAVGVPIGRVMAPYFLNNPSDNAYVISVKISSAQQFVSGGQASGQTSAGRFANEIESITVAESVTVAIA